MAPAKSFRAPLRKTSSQRKFKCTWPGDVNE